MPRRAIRCAIILGILDLAFRPMLRMKSLIAEGRMKRQWTVQRQFKACDDGEQRWDRAYQYLLKWATAAHAPLAVPEPASPLIRQEVDHAGSRICPGFHTSSD